MMSLNKNLAKPDTNTGFGTNAASYGGRLLNKDGMPNIVKKGVTFFERYSWFHSMLSVSRWRFFITILIVYIIVNLLFTLTYYLIGVQHLSGLNPTSEKEKFIEAFFFSTQTFTTVGYGRIAPVGVAMNVVASFQALIGLLSFALATGLMYGRFSRPRAFIKFAENAIIAPFNNATALMIRLAPFKNTTLTEAVAKITLIIPVQEQDKYVNKILNLDLELITINALTLSWTLVHPITPESPLYQLTKQDYENTKGELIVFIKAFDDMFSNTVIARTSYIFNEIKYGFKYTPMFYRDVTLQTTVLELNKLNDTVEVVLED